MESEDQYFHLLPELRQLMLLSSKPPIFPAAASDHLYSLSPPLPSPPLPHPPFISAVNGGVSSSQSRWPRQETLTLLEIRARLDPQFREAGQKAPLWDQVARIMAEEYGYQRSGRKCREKLDNLYKYYKKTKEGKIGKHEGKHYRFFRQLEALYSPSTTTTAATIIKSSNPSIAKKLNLLENQNTLLFSTWSESSAEEEEEEEYSRTKNWITELVEAQMKRLLEMQEAWFEKMMRSFERMEQERVRREESWRREEAERHEKERRRLASERACSEKREAALIMALEKIIQQRESLGPAMMVRGGEEREEMECDLSRAMGVL
ncbi:trihelix transcription factor PTL-like [Dendrobium catenatum]|uniref:Trihelix transcription factor PTL n=1 Tax=Dendrobium catenatum TaxID=906689 RepID=A0A2I0VMJ3_9ASPA|nr:trihelix transcription factor PTL-like [Dendrobium catenatum]PKU64635.1 Trihelix transcription factor PTL [Dendrobium catenatum]